MRSRNLAIFLLTAGLSGLLLSADGSKARAGGLFSADDVEKPAPAFTRKAGEIEARLIPRAKSTSVAIVFAVGPGGRLEAVAGVDFAEVDRPEVDVKNFKSAAFRIGIGEMAQGAEVELFVRSDFFSSSTAFYVFNPNRDTPWTVPAIRNRALSGRVRELAVSVRDGGELDADGRADGRATVIGGPRDSFWGYALGTLFIRFFGIFIVLSILMAGMLVSGWIFRRLADRKEGGASGATVSPPSPAPDADAPPTGEIAAVIAAALHIHTASARRAAGGPDPSPATPESGWAAGGRSRIMNERLSAFNRAFGRNRQQGS